MVLKPISKTKIENDEDDQTEEEFEEEQESSEEFIDPKYTKRNLEQIKKAVNKRPVKQETEDDEEPSVTREEVIDMITGHLNRAFQLLQALK